MTVNCKGGNEDGLSIVHSFYLNLYIFNTLVLVFLTCLNWSGFMFMLLQHDYTKRRSLPANLHLPQICQLSEENKSLSRARRRQSLSDIGFGRMETYIKLGKLGQVCFFNCSEN